MKLFNKIVRSSALALDYASCVFLFVMMTFVTVYVILRAFGIPIFGTYEIVQLCSLLVVSLSLAHNEYDSGNITIDFLDNYLGKTGKKMLMIVSLFATFGISAVAAYRMYFFMLEKIADGSVTANLAIPQWVFLLIMLITFAMLTLVSFFKMLCTIVNYDYMKDNPEASEDEIPVV